MDHLPPRRRPIRNPPRGHPLRGVAGLRVVVGVRPELLHPLAPPPPPHGRRHHQRRVPMHVRHRLRGAVPPGDDQRAPPGDAQVVRRGGRAVLPVVEPVVELDPEFFADIEVPEVRQQQRLLVRLYKRSPEEEQAVQGLLAEIEIHNVPAVFDGCQGVPAARGRGDGGVGVVPPLHVLRAFQLVQIQGPQLTGREPRLGLPPKDMPRVSQHRRPRKQRPRRIPEPGEALAPLEDLVELGPLAVLRGQPVVEDADGPDIRQILRAVMPSIDDQKSVGRPRGNVAVTRWRSRSDPVFRI
mmetsp:Transcript_95159/g.254358  ORF Transcript_95159/g.254358 Transcript_95159/m.254358 type:complete len:297 (-) Transcript_95159:391-1281(-)